MERAIDEGWNQYNRTAGTLPLVNKVAEKYGPLLGRKIDPLKEVLVTSGAGGALNSFIQALINPGDDLVVMEPQYPMYIDHTLLSGGKMNTVPLDYSKGTWRFNPDQLHKALSNPASKVFVMNSPHNPTGKVFTREEQEIVTEILDDCPHVITLSDEVYNFATFDDREHVPFATLGDNWHRTVSIYSGGKFFNATGWKIGWAIAPEKLIHLGGVVANTTFYCFNTPGQVAFSYSLDEAEKPFTTTIDGVTKETTYKAEVGWTFESCRNYLQKELSKLSLPWEILECEGGYFLMADVSKCQTLVPA